MSRPPLVAGGEDVGMTLYSGDEFYDDDVTSGYEEPWNCVDCGIPLEPGTPPICEECVDA